MREAIEAVEFVLNGQKRRLEVDPDRSLLSVLRDDLDLTGTKYGCGEGKCGACTVSLDGTPTRSCQTPMSECAGRQVATIESLEKDGQLHPLQEAFLSCGAMQCGYCTPGMIMSGACFLAKHPTPSTQEAAKALEGNVCRCGTYGRILLAMKMAADTIAKGGTR